MTDILERFDRGELHERVMPSYVRALLERLTEAGYEAYIVGGCVRDFLMGKVPSDWDVCTSALPGQIKDCFKDKKTVDTGIVHGTVTVFSEEQPVEITTYRIDGDYRDGRHPVSVVFTKSLEEDLKRRDFTMNAMAYHFEQGLIDLFGGRQAVSARIIASVGEPEQRFKEDALRIMRGLRFAAVLGFKIEAQTLTAMYTCADLLKQISKERISGELAKLLLGDFADSVLKNCGEILQVTAEGIKPSKVSHLPKVLSLRLAAVFPENTETCLRKLSFSGQIVREGAVFSRLLNGMPPGSEMEVKKLMWAEGDRIARLYLAALGREAEAERIFASGACRNLQQLAVNGKDLMDAGIPSGRAVGETLNRLLTQVIEGSLPNEREVLLEYCKNRRTGVPKNTVKPKSGNSEKHCKICRKECG